MADPPDTPSDDERDEAAIDELARRSASAVRRPPPTGAIDSVIAAGTRRKRIQAGAAVGGVAVLAVAAFAFTRGGEDADTVTADTAPPTVPATESAASTTVEAPTSTVGATTATAPFDEALGWALDFTGGPGGKATGDPVRIGLAGIDPTVSRATVELINSELGGVKGRPVELVECNWTDPAGAAACGEQLAADPTISAVISPVDPVELRTALGPDVPRVGGFITNSTGITYGASIMSQIYAMTDLIRQELPLADKVAVIDRSGPASSLFVSRMSGIELVDVVADITSASSVAAAVREAGAVDADAFITMLPVIDCSPIASALAEVGARGPVVSDVCTNAEDGWYYIDVPVNPDNPSTRWGAAAAIELLSRSGVELSSADDPFGNRSGEFADVMNVVKVLNGLGDRPGRAEVLEALTTFQGPAAISGPQDCTLQQAPTPFPLGCAKFVQVLRVEGGKFVSQEPVEITP